MTPSTTQLDKRNGSAAPENAANSQGQPAASSTPPSEKGLHKASRQIRATAASLLGLAAHGFQRQLVTIDVDDRVARIVIIKKTTVVAWATAPLADGPLTSGDTSEARPPTAASQLKDILNSLPVQSGRVVSCLPHQNSLSRRLSMPQIGKRYLNQVAVSEILETLPFLENEVDIGWQIQNAKEGRQVLAVAAPKTAVDEHVRLLAAAQLQSVTVYPRAVALARVAAVPDVIIVDLSGSTAAVILVREGWPVVTRWIELPDTSLEEQRSTLVEAVEAVTEQQNASPYSEQPAPSSLLIVGPLAARQELVESLLAMLPMEPVAVDSPLQWPAHFPALEYAANLGIAQAFKPRSKPHTRLMGHRKPPPSLLPARHAPRKLPLLPTAAFTLLFLLGYIGLLAGANVEAASSTQASLQSRADNLERRERTQKLNINRANGIKQRIASTTQFASSLDSQLSALNTESKVLLAQLQVITQDALPPEGRLSTLSLQKDGFSLTGVLSSYDDVILYAENLRASGLFSEVKVTRVDSASGTPDTPTAVFQIKAAPATVRK